MFKEVLDASLDKLKEAPFIFSATETENDKRVTRGEFGKNTLPKAPACFMLHDFAPPKDLEDFADRKIPRFEITLFVIGQGAKTQIAAEDSVMQLAETIEDRMTSDLLLVQRFDGTEEYNRWEFNNIEWIERKQTGCVLALTFQMDLWK